MQDRISRRRALAGLAAVGALAVAGCGSPDGEGTPGGVEESPDGGAGDGAGSPT